MFKDKQENNINTSEKEKKGLFASLLNLYNSDKCKVGINSFGISTGSSTVDNFLQIDNCGGVLDLALLFLPIGWIGLAGKAFLNASKVALNSEKLLMLAKNSKVLNEGKNLTSKGYSIVKNQIEMTMTPLLKKANYPLSREVTPEVFLKELDASMKSLDSKIAWRVTPHTLEEYKEIVDKGGKLYTIKGSGGTFAITAEKDIISVCKNLNNKNVYGTDIMKEAVEKGGRTLDSYTGNLKFYEKAGFEMVSVTKGVKEFLPNEAKELIDKGVLKLEDVGAFVYKGNDTRSYKKVSVFMNETGKKYVDNIVDKKTGEVLEYGYDRMINERNNIASKLWGIKYKKE